MNRSHDRVATVSFFHEQAQASVALENPLGEEYPEEAFRFFLDVERARAHSSNQPLRLLFATIEPEPGKPASIPPATATRLFRGLRMALRETDVTGWYRQHRVAGAVLSERPNGTPSDSSSDIQKRVCEQMREHLPSSVARSLRVRIIPLKARPLTE